MISLKFNVNSILCKSEMPSCNNWCFEAFYGCCLIGIFRRDIESSWIFVRENTFDINILNGVKDAKDNLSEIDDILFLLNRGNGRSE